MPANQSRIRADPLRTQANFGESAVCTRGLQSMWHPVTSQDGGRRANFGEFVQTFYRFQRIPVRLSVANHREYIKRLVLVHTNSLNRQNSLVIRVNRDWNAIWWAQEFGRYRITYNSQYFITITFPLYVSVNWVKFGSLSVICLSNLNQSIYMLYSTNINLLPVCVLAM